MEVTGVILDISLEGRNKNFQRVEGRVTEYSRQRK